MGQYLPIIVMAILAVVFVAASLMMSRLGNPPKPNAAKSSPYECGIDDNNEQPHRFDVRFYLIAMIFVILDIEIVFLYPYVMNADSLGTFGVFAIVEFSVAVFAAFVYLIANGALSWGPPRVVSDGSSIDRESANRTLSSTIRRVGNEGRRAA